MINCDEACTPYKHDIQCDNHPKNVQIEQLEKKLAAALEVVEAARRLDETYVDETKTGFFIGRFSDLRAALKKFDKASETTSEGSGE